MHDLGKATTPAHTLPGHHGHEKRGVDLVKAFCRRWRIPRAHTELALITTEYHSHVHRALELKDTTLLKLFSKTDIFRKPQRFKKMIQACLADLRGRLNFEDAAYPQADFLNQLGDKLRNADLSEVKQNGLQGSQLGEAIRRLRLKIIKQYGRSLKSDL
jgi:tRNA nucleotidyltransferase (CCA-adding enzyme)